MSGLVNVLSDSRDRGTFAGEETTVEVEMIPIEDSGGEDSSWIGSFGEDTVEVNCVEGGSPKGSLLSRDFLADNSSGGSFAISSFGMEEYAWSYWLLTCTTGIRISNEDTCSSPSPDL